MELGYCLQNQWFSPGRKQRFFNLKGVEVYELLRPAADSYWAVLMAFMGLMFLSCGAVWGAAIGIVEGIAWIDDKLVGRGF